MRKLLISSAMVAGRVVLCACLYAVRRGIPSSVVRAVVPALVLEATLYTATLLSVTRNGLGRLRPWWIASILSIASVFPWLLYPYREHGVLLLALLVPVAFWYVWFPVTRVVDLTL